MESTQFLMALLAVCLCGGLAMAVTGPAEAEPGALPKLDARFGEASARTDGRDLIVSTGSVERHFAWTGRGFVTTGLRNLESGKEWANAAPAYGADWSYPGLLPEDARAELLSLSAAKNGDEGFTDEHLQVVAEVRYPEQGLTLKMTIWAYPGAPGLRQQLWAKGTGAPGGKGGRVDALPVDTSGTRVTAAGYYSDTQHRNTPQTPVLREEALAGAGECDWASLLFVEAGGDGLTLVKESHKTVQMPGVDTGLFRFGKAGVENTGWCLGRQDLAPDEYRWLWGSWVVLHRAGADERERALKAFDRRRFPTDKARDMWLVMCTWGHSKGGDGRTYASEEQVLKEMPHVADLGIDMLLIDDGWQAPRGGNLAPGRGWKPHPDVYPTQDWTNVVARAGELHLRLGLWSAWQISLDDLVWNWERLGQEQQKIDFASLDTHAKLDALRQKVRAFLLRAGHRCIISWDTTEVSPRYGFYSFREYGNVHFMNRKPEWPGNVLYVPWLALRDFWMLARYQNLNKWQLVIQNPEVTVRESPDAAGRVYHSDACLHGVDYCVATALMGTPEFMAVTRFYSEGARKVLRPLIAEYKAVRSEIWDSTVYPIGDEPTNGSWTGFQAVHPDGRHGYLTLFRELENKEPTAKLALRLLAPGTRLKLTDLRTGKSRPAVLDGERRVEFAIAQAPGFLFLKYERE